MQIIEIFDLFFKTIQDYHQFDNVNTLEKNPYKKDNFGQLLYGKSWIDCVQWHLEDIIRDPEIDAEKALGIKRHIDKSNQLRTDMVEKIDRFYFERFKDVMFQPDSRINTESPAWAIDRLSILALKIYHIETEANRIDISDTLKKKNQLKHKVLLTQKTDLTLAIDQLLEDLAKGYRIMKVYRQMKMYNDPELNPVLYTSKNNI